MLHRAAASLTHRPFVAPPSRAGTNKTVETADKFWATVEEQGVELRLVAYTPASTARRHRTTLIDTAGRVLYDLDPLINTLIIFYDAQNNRVSALFIKYRLCGGAGPLELEPDTRPTVVVSGFDKGYVNVKTFIQWVQTAAQVKLERGDVEVVGRGRVKKRANVAFIRLLTKTQAQRLVKLPNKEYKSVALTIYHRDDHLGELRVKWTRLTMMALQYCGILLPSIDYCYETSFDFSRRYAKWGLTGLGPGAHISFMVRVTSTPALNQPNKPNLAMLHDLYNDIIAHVGRSQNKKEAEGESAADSAPSLPFFIVDMSGANVKTKTAALRLVWDQALPTSGIEAVIEDEVSWVTARAKTAEDDLASLLNNDGTKADVESAKAKALSASIDCALLHVIKFADLLDFWDSNMDEDIDNARERALITSAINAKAEERVRQLEVRAQLQADPGELAGLDTDHHSDTNTAPPSPDNDRAQTDDDDLAERSGWETEREQSTVREEFDDNTLQLGGSILSSTASIHTSSRTNNNGGSPPKKRTHFNEAVKNRVVIRKSNRPGEPIYTVPASICLENKDHGGVQALAIINDTSDWRSYQVKLSGRDKQNWRSLPCAVLVHGLAKGRIFFARVSTSKRPPDTNYDIASSVVEEGDIWNWTTDMDDGPGTRGGVGVLQVFPSERRRLEISNADQPDAAKDGSFLGIPEPFLEMAELSETELEGDGVSVRKQADRLRGYNRLAVVEAPKPREDVPSQLVHENGPSLKRSLVTMATQLIDLVKDSAGRQTPQSLELFLADVPGGSRSELVQKRADDLGLDLRWGLNPAAAVSTHKQILQAEDNLRDAFKSGEIIDALFSSSLSIYALLARNLPSPTQD